MGVVLGMIISSLIITPAAAGPVPAFRASFLVPAYFYPSGDKWQQMCSTLRAAARQAVVIMNPDSGPGLAKNRDYTAAVATCHQRPIAQTVVGYVKTQYGDRSAADIKADIDKYYAWYAVNGIFFDQMSNSAADKALYLDVYNYVKSKAASTMVVGNPGIPASTNWQLAAPVVADVLVVFEGSATTYASWNPPAWVMQIRPPAGVLAHLVYGARSARISMPPSTLPTTQWICAASKAAKGGWMDVTSNGQVKDPNPWDGPPDLVGMSTYC